MNGLINSIFLSFHLGIYIMETLQLIKVKLWTNPMFQNPLYRIEEKAIQLPIDGTNTCVLCRNSQTDNPHKEIFHNNIEDGFTFTIPIIHSYSQYTNGSVYIAQGKYYRRIPKNQTHIVKLNELFYCYDNESYISQNSDGLIFNITKINTTTSYSFALKKGENQIGRKFQSISDIGISGHHISIVVEDNVLMFKIIDYSTFGVYISTENPFLSRTMKYMEIRLFQGRFLKIEIGDFKDFDTCGPQTKGNIDKTPLVNENKREVILNDKEKKHFTDFTNKNEGMQIKVDEKKKELKKEGKSISIEQIKLVSPFDS